LDVALDDLWNPRRGWNVNFERFLRREVLGGLAPGGAVGRWGDGASSDGSDSSDRSNNHAPPPHPTTAPPRMPPQHPAPALVGGHPYLVRRGLYAMTTDGLDIEALEAQADSEEGIFGDHLGRMLAALTQDAELCQAVGAVLQGSPCPTATSFYRLRSGGVLA